MLDFSVGHVTHSSVELVKQIRMYCTFRKLETSIIWPQNVHFYCFRALVVENSREMVLFHYQYSLLNYERFTDNCYYNYCTCVTHHFHLRLIRHSDRCGGTGQRVHPYQSAQNKIPPLWSDHRLSPQWHHTEVGTLSHGSPGYAPMYMCVHGLKKVWWKTLKPGGSELIIV